jgi:alpha-tubulin suppressor-like RCC1 family protein
MDWGVYRRAAAVLALAAIVALGLLPSGAARGDVSAGGGVYAFGDNQFGELGNPTNMGSTSPNATPATVVLPGENAPATEVASGDDRSLVVTASGQLYAFGAGVSQPGSIGGETSTPTLVTLPGQTGPVTRVATGIGDSLAVTESGQLYAWGDNYYGELGSPTNNGTSYPVATPTPVVLPGQAGGVTQVAAGAYHSLALTAGGQLYAFGDNADGQLGNNDNTTTAIANPTPTLVTLPGQIGAITEIAAGATDSFAVTESGQVYAFGDNQFGQLGTGVNSGGGEPNVNPTPVPVVLPGADGPVTRVAAGAYHTLAVTASGQLYAFGDNFYGQLGNTINNGAGVPNPTPTLVTLPGEVGAVTQITGGFGHSLVATASGQLYAFGDNQSGQLGIATNSGTTYANPTPTLVALPSPPGMTIDLAPGPYSLHSLVVVSTVTLEPSRPVTTTVTVAPPKVSAVTETHRAWREGNRLARVSSVGRPVGTTFRFTLDQRAAVTFTFSRRLQRTVGTIRFTGHAGPNTVAFAGRITRKHRLPPGSYTLTIRARNRAGKASRARTVRFTILG